MKVLVVSDPIVEELNSGNWMPGTAWFRLAGRLRGFAVDTITVDERSELQEFLDGNNSEYRIFLTSPYNSRIIPASPPGEPRVIIAGGAIPEGSAILESVYADRVAAMHALGVLAGEKAGGMVLMLVNRNTPIRSAEADSFILGFLDSGRSRDELLMVDIAESTGDGIPPQFNEAVLNSSMLALLAASYNLRAFIDTAEDQLPVLTENSAGFDFGKERIIASVEDNPAEFRHVLFEQMTNESGNGQKTYQSRLSGK